MKIKYSIMTLISALIFYSNPASASEFKLISNDISEGHQLSLDHVFKGFGCEGKNVSPHLSWSGAPAETKSYAITVYDPDAPTGSGWWHWNLVNIPATTSSVARAVKSGERSLDGSTSLKNDYGSIGFGGACPPPGEVHRYQFTVHALGVEKIELPENASNALAGFMINANSLATAKITAVYTRDK